MYKLHFRIEKNDGPHQEISKAFCLKFEIKYNSNSFKAYVNRYFEDKAGGTYLIVNRRFFKTKVLVTQATDILDENKNLIGKVISNTKISRKVIKNTSSSPFTYLKAGTYIPLLFTGENTLHISSNDKRSKLIGEIGNAISNLLQPLNDFYKMYSILSTITSHSEGEQESSQIDPVSYN